MPSRLINTVSPPSDNTPIPHLFPPKPKRGRSSTPRVRKPTRKAIARTSIPFDTPPPDPLPAPPKPRLILDFRRALASTPTPPPKLPPKPQQLGHEVKIYFSPTSTAYTTAWSRILTRDAGALVRACRPPLKAGMRISALRLPDVAPGDFGCWQTWVADKEAVEERMGIGDQERWEWVEEMVRAWLFGKRFAMREFQDALMRCLRREGRRLRGTRAAEAETAAAGCRPLRRPLSEALVREVWARTEQMSVLRLFLVHVAAECSFPSKAPAAWFTYSWLVEGFSEEWDMGQELFSADAEERRENGVSEWDYDKLDERTKRDFYVKEAAVGEANAKGDMNVRSLAAKGVA